MTWLRDWRVVGVLLAAILAGLLSVVVVLALRERAETLSLLEVELERGEALQSQVDELTGQVAELSRLVEVLQDQVRSLGGTPVTETPAPSGDPPAPDPPPVPPVQESSAAPPPVPGGGASPIPAPDPPSPADPAPSPPPPPAEPDPEPGLLDPITDLTCTLGLLCP